MGFNELSGGQFLAIDDVSFTKEPCKQIPWKQNEGTVETGRVVMNQFPMIGHIPTLPLGIPQVCLFVCLFVSLFSIFDTWPLSIKCIYFIFRMSKRPRYGKRRDP